MEKKGKVQVVAMLVFMACSSMVSGATIGEQCSPEFTKVTACLTFATGRAEAPTKECCSSVTDIKGKDPVCLCYILQQVHNGTIDQIKNLGIQEARLFQLPSACKVTGGNISDCPKLLHLPANSPASAVFTNSSASATTTTPATTSSASTSLPTPTANKSNGFKQLSAGPIALTMAIMVIFFYAFP